MHRPARLVSLTFLAAFGLPDARGHDIPNARIERSIQVELRPRRLLVDYELSLSELTLTQDLRGLIGSLPGGDRGNWFKRYGEATGPLNARGLVVAIDGEPIELSVRGFDLLVEQHPRFTFHFEAKIPDHGHLRVIDSNYAASEGSSRLAIRGRDGVEIVGDSLPTDVDQIKIKAAWELSPAEETRTKRVDVDYRLGGSTSEVAPPVADRSSTMRPARREGLSTLLDRAGRSSWMILAALAFVLGIAHSIQPGHGKSLIVAASLGRRGGSWRGAATGLAATLGHLASVLTLAGVLWATGANRYGDWNSLILHVTGFLLAAAGLWRVGHYLGSGDGSLTEAPIRHDLSTLGYLGLGLTSGVVPCWDAVALLIVANALGRLGLGLVLLLAFSLGMAVVLAGIGALASSFQARIDPETGWRKPLGILGGSLLAIMGALFLTS